MLSIIMVSSLAGCGATATSSASASASTSTAAADSTSAKAPVTISMFIQKNAIDAWGQKIKDQFEAQNKDIKIEFNILAESKSLF